MSQQQVEGIVFRVYEKPFQDRKTRRNITLHTVKLDGDPVWYRAGEKRFAGIAEQGNFISFTAEPIEGAKDPSARIVGEVTLAKAPSNGASGTPTAAPAAPYQDRNNSIVYQSSRKDALEFVKLVLSVNGLKLPKAQPDILGAIEDTVDRYTALFFEDVGTLGAVVREAEENVEDTKAPVEDDGE